ncbi:MAG TPA: hypothetical protein VMD05_09080 [Candidatus Nanoarchaeia archaeon]|nr:hypothetical protein [Candidatus Nanoarchaeia archaeon]
MAGMTAEDLTKEKLWQILVETVHACVMYPTHKSYTRDFILKQKPDVTAAELALRLNMPLGEALVILGELRPDNKNAT